MSDSVQGSNLVWFMSSFGLNEINPKIMTYFHDNSKGYVVVNS